MTGTVPFLWVPYVAMLCYILLLVAALSAKKDKVIKAFVLYLFLFMLWTAGATLMRMLAPPGYKFWYQVSLLSLFANSFGIYNFVYRFIGYDNRSERRNVLILTIIMLVLTYFEVFLKIPEQAIREGRTVFIYHADWRVFIPTFICVVIVGLAVKNIIKSYRQNNTEVFALVPAGIGIIVLIIGNLLSVFPKNIFPFDTLSSIFNAILTFYCLTQKRQFKLTLLVSRKALMFITLLFAAIIGARTIYPLERYIKLNIDVISDYSVIVVSLIFTFLVFALYNIIKYLIDAIFLKKDQIAQQKIKNFSNAATKSLEINDILSLLGDVLKSELGVHKIYVCLRDKTTGKYNTLYSSNPLNVNTINISDETPYVKWFAKNDNCMIVKEFKRSVLYWSMWDSEKKSLAENDIQCIAPLKHDDALIGLILLGAKQEKRKYGYDDITFLDSIRAITSIATSNATMYDSMRERANKDSITGLLNRRAFHERLEEECNNPMNHSIAIIIINLDDFRLFNELYGSAGGDELLRCFGEIINNSAGRDYVVSRYGGKEFAICMPNCNQLQAVNLAESLRNQLSEKRSNAEGVLVKNVTFCAGICTIPIGASNSKELLTNANMCVYQGKREGKNRICTYCGVGEIGVRRGLDKCEQEDKYEDCVSTIYALTAAIDAKDHYTFDHSRAVATYAVALAERIGLSDSHIKLIREAGLLHDIGKIAIPEKILTKPGKLTNEEYAIMQTHVEHSIEIIRHLPNLDYLIPAVIGHHERYNGKGYPRGIRGENIPLTARCLTIADCFDAMTSKRTYKEKYSYEYAANEIREQAGRQFDPVLAEVFVNMIEDGTIYPDMPKIS